MNTTSGSGDAPNGLSLADLVACMRTLTVQDNVHTFQQVCSRDLELTLLEEHAGRYIPIVEDASDFLALLYVPFTWQRCVPPGISTNSLSTSQVLGDESCVGRLDRLLARIPYSRRPPLLLTSYLGLTVE